MLSAYAFRLAPIKSSMSSYTFPVCSKKVASRAILSFPVRSAYADGFFRVGRPHPERGGPGKDKTILPRIRRPSITTPDDLKRFLGQSSWPCTYCELTPRAVHADHRGLAKPRSAIQPQERRTPASSSPLGDLTEANIHRRPRRDRRTLTPGGVERTLTLPHPPHHRQHLARGGMAGVTG